MPLRNFILLSLSAGALALSSSCGRTDQDDSGAAASPPPVETTLARERAAHFFKEEQRAQARAELAPLVEGDKAALDDLVRAAAVELAAHQIEAAQVFVRRILERDPEHPGGNYLAGRIAFDEIRFEEAEGAFRRVLKNVPTDLPSKLSLGRTLEQLDRVEEALEIFEDALRVGIHDGGSWYVMAVYKLFTFNVMLGNEEEAQRYEALWHQLEAGGFTSVTDADLRYGWLAEVAFPEPVGTSVPTPVNLPTFEPPAELLPELAGAAELMLRDFDGGRVVDVCTWGPQGVRLALQELSGWQVQTIHAGPIDAACTFDLGNDDALDFVLASGAELLFYGSVGEAGEELWARGKISIRDPDAPEETILVDVELPQLPDTPTSITPVDFDHDGDLDLLCVGSFGARLLRHDGADKPGGRFTDVSEEASMPRVALSWCVTEDFDTDQDVDMLFGGPGALALLSSQRAGLFEDVTEAAFGADVRFQRPPLVADLDADARPDILVADAEGAVSIWHGGADGRFTRASMDWTLPADGPLFAEDFDRDGIVDLAGSSEAALLDGVLAPGLSVATAFTAGDAPRGPIGLADLDRDGFLDIAEVTDSGLAIHAGADDGRPAAVIEWIGIKDNRRAIGAVCEVRVGGAYRRVYWRGDAVVFGLGEQQWADIARVTWPNGVVQSLLDVEPGYLPPDIHGDMAQVEGLVGSCPFLYTWNGERFEFISDVLGITPLGLPMAPGMLVPPDHDEFVLVRGDQMRPRDGFLELQFTEELREVTYLDRLRLDVVDHPVGTEIYPDERFTFPPFPAAHTHSVRAPVAPRSALGSDGRDWAPELAAIDDRHAVPFTPLESQFLGLARPHFLELAFDPADLEGASKLRLVMTGWFYWTDASVNMAAARTPGVDFVPPLFQVPDGEGGWQDAGPPVGFPAGKTKSMVIDVTRMLQRDDPRLRIFSTLRLYWDSIRLATDGDDAPLTVTSLEPHSAQLWARGFSMPIASDRADLPERFDWDNISPNPRWNQHPGNYTRLGDVLPLLGQIDDQFIVMGSGDALHVRFDARDLPPPAEGMVRDYLVFMDGWAKDRDPNTIEALEVEPYPFHGMSGYPYGPDESFPDGPEHREWRRAWQTRPAREQIPPIAPSRQLEWLGLSAGAQ